MLLSLISSWNCLLEVLVTENCASNNAVSSVLLYCFRLALNGLESSVDAL